MEQGDLATRLIESEQKLASMPELEDELARARAENAALQAELGATREALQGVVGSSSWRATAPLRRLLSALRRL